MQLTHNRLRRVQRVFAAAAAAGVLFGSIGLGNSAYAVNLPSTPTVDTELNAQSSTYLTAVLAERAESRAQALARMDRKADEYAQELAAAAELQAALLNMKSEAVDGFVAPLASFARTSHFGATSPLWESVHTGEDFAAPTGTPLVAIGEGVVTDVGDAGAYGLRTIITLSNGTEIWYCHQITAVVKSGDRVKTGQPIGAVGATGNTTGPHLHLEVRPVGGAPIDPVKWLAALGVVV